MPDTKLPPLPDTHIVLLSDLQSGTEPGFNAHHMRAYANAVLEAAAKACEEQKPQNEVSDWTEIAHIKAKALDCASAAIRAMKEPQ